MLIEKFRIIFICGFSILFLAACAEQHRHSGSPESKDTVRTMKESITIKGSGMYEECFELGKEQKLHYKFDANRPVDFNVHFHAEDDIHYPVQQSEITQYNGMIDPGEDRFQAGDQESYCLMWENQDMRPVRLSYECIVKGK